MSIKIYHQNVFERWQIEDTSVQAIITSPPYYSLRKYDIPDVTIGGDKNCNHNIELNSNTCQICNAWKGQYGLEPTYTQYLSNCMLWIEEAWRVLRDDGCLFLNIADTYVSAGGASRHRGYGDPKYPNGRNSNFDEPSAYPQPFVKTKSKMLIPERLMVMMVDAGWIIRNHIVWFKVNGLPESVADRFSKKWETVIFAVKKPKYFFNLDAVKEPYKQVSIDRLNRAVSNTNKWVNSANGQSPMGLSQPRPNINTKISKEDAETFSSPRARIHRDKILGLNTNKNNRRRNISKGKNPGDIWEIATQPSSEKHFAMWPEKLVRKMILCSTKEDDIVLDPFCGSATTGKVAIELRRNFIGIDLGYADIQERKLSNVYVKPYDIFEIYQKGKETEK